MRMISTTFVLLAMISMPTAASSQNTDVPFLAGLRSFTIVIANLDEKDETSCGVTRTGVVHKLAVRSRSVGHNRHR